MGVLDVLDGSHLVGGLADTNGVDNVAKELNRLPDFQLLLADGDAMEAAVVKNREDPALVLVPCVGSHEDVVHQLDDAIKARKRFFCPLAEPVPRRAEAHGGDRIGVLAPREEERREELTLGV